MPLVPCPVPPLRGRLSKRLPGHLLNLLPALLLAACGGGHVDDPKANAAADTFTVDWNQAAALDVQANDSSSGAAAEISLTVQPQHGVATVEGKQIRYTPAAGYFGPDKLSYRLRADTASSSADVTLAVQASLSLSGVVSDGPLAKALVKATVGSQTLSTQADEAGRYTIKLKSSNPADFISLSAQGQGSQSTVVLSALAGELGGLAANASSDGAINAQAALNITHISSAVAELIQQAASAPSSDAQLAQQTALLDSQALLQAAALIKLVVDEGVALPEGAATTQALLKSPTLLNAFAAAQDAANASKLESIKQGLVNDPALAAPPPKPAAQDLVLNFAYGGGASTMAPQLLLHPDGTAEVADYFGTRAAIWRNDGKILSLSYTSPAVQSSFTFDAAGEQWPIDIVNTGLEIKLIGPRQGNTGLVMINSKGYSLSTGGPQKGTREDFPDYWSPLKQVDPKAQAALSSKDFAIGSRWAGLLNDFSVEKANAGDRPQDILRITSATEAVFEHSGVKASWAINNGALSLTLPSGSYRYSRLTAGTLGDERWLVALDQSGSKYQLELGVMQAPAQAQGWAGVDFARQWVSQLNAAVSRGIFKYWFRANGQGGTSSQEPGEAESAVSWGSRNWALQADGRIEILSPRGTRSSNGNSCNVSASDADCIPTSRRYWELIGRRGSTVFVLEIVSFSGEPALQRFYAFTDVGPSN